jgi:hypothetical protein
MVEPGFGHFVRPMKLPEFGEKKSFKRISGDGQRGFTLQ